MSKHKNPSIESTAFTMQDVLSLCGDDPPLGQRQAIHMVQTEMVSHRHFVSATAKRRLYSIWNLLEFEIGRMLFVGFGVPPVSVKEIIQMLHRRGFFLAPEQFVAIDRDKKRFDNPAEFREHLIQTYKLNLFQYSAPYNLVQKGHETMRVPRSPRQMKHEIKQVAYKVRELARKGSRPWPLYVLVFRDGDGWGSKTGELPGQLFIESEGSAPQVKVDEESYREFFKLISDRPGAILINLHQLEGNLRRRFDKKYGVADGAVTKDGS